MSRTNGSVSRSIFAWRETTGVRPMVSATASTPLARAGICLDENSGASRNSGETRASTRKNVATCCSENRAISSLAFISGPDVVRDRGPQLLGPRDERVEHPRAGDRHDGDQRDDLRDERERLLLDLRDRLEDRDHQADHQAGEEHRRGHLHGDRHHRDDEADDGVLRHVWNELTRDDVTRFQPPTRTNSRILNGREMNDGGSIIIPIDISVEETTRSMIRNGRKIRKPIWNDVLSSEIVNAGISTSVGTSLRVLTFLRCASLTKRATSLVRVCFHMKARSGTWARSSATVWVIWCFCSGS